MPVGLNASATLKALVSRDQLRLNRPRFRVLLTWGKQGATACSVESRRFFRNKHYECVDKHEPGRRQITDLILEGLHHQRPLRAP
jgi:hypothetical protein